MTKQEQITDFLNRHVTGLPRCYGTVRQCLVWYGMRNEPRPSAEEIAKEFLGITEFRALQLGTWLGTTDGEVITQAVELSLPMFYSEDVALLVDALKLAAATQQQEGRQKAIASGVVSVALLGLSYVASRTAAA